MRKLLLFAAPFALLSAQEITHDVVIQAQATTSSSAPRQIRMMSDPANTISVDMGSSSVVKNSPYSAEAVTETVQTLADGNKITRKNTVTQYRDAAGRTRHEFELQSFGRLGDVEAGANQSISIDDPVAKVHYSLDVKRKTAMKVPVGEGMFTMATPDMLASEPMAAGIIGGVAGGPMVTRTFERAPMAGVARAGAPTAMAFAGNSIALATTSGLTMKANDAKEEDLGSRNIEGVEAKGTRSTVTIPAGEVGNERELNIVMEKWYSDQLKTFVLTRHSDPRVGEITHRLTNVRLSEPPATLFEVPADFMVQEPQMMRAPMMRKRAQE